MLTQEDDVDAHALHAKGVDDHVHAPDGFQAQHPTGPITIGDTVTSTSAQVYSGAGLPITLTASGVVRLIPRRCRRW